MCILLYTSSHPLYSHILLSNRDEFLSRPTSRASWWSPPHTHVLGGRDLQRSVQGTWLGITAQGRVAALTNFREEGEKIVGERSRGEMPKMFLGVPEDSGESAEEFAERLVEGEGVQGVGGFSLVFGRLGRVQRSGQGQGQGQEQQMEDGLGGRRAERQLGIVSNRMKEAKEVRWPENGTWGLSNAHYGDRTWPKVVHGEALLDDLVTSTSSTTSTQQSQDELIERCFEILSTDTLPRWEEGQSWATFVKELRNSIFIPAISEPVKGAHTSTTSADEMAAARDGSKISGEGAATAYGTQRQTVILVDHAGKVTFVERALYDRGGEPVPESERDTRFEFDIQGW